jgi:gluconokinase
MGVSGAGKSEVGAALAERLGTRFTDAGSLHPQANVAKMSAGVPLTDEDRWPWLTLVGQELARADPDGIVVACSASCLPPSSRPSLGRSNRWLPTKPD